MSSRIAEEIIFHELPEANGITAVEGTNIRNNFPRHTHSCYIFLRVDRGERTVSINGSDIICRAGEMLFINPRTPHRCISASKPRPQTHSYRAICAAPDYIRRTAEQISDRAERLPNFIATPLSNKRLDKCFQQFFALINIRGTTLEKQSALNNFLSGALLKNSGAPPLPAEIGTQNQSMVRVHSYIMKNYRSNITLSDLSGIGCISPYHLQRLFLESYGSSPHEFMIKLRIQKALELLKGGLSSAETAFETGFADQSHFSRHFKKNIGVSPGRYAKSNLTADAQNNQHCL